MKNSGQIKTIIIEDNLDSQEFLENNLLEHYPTISIEGKATSIKESIQLIKKVQPELVFMDIELTDGLSFEVFNTITIPDFEVIFITGLDDQLENAFEHCALGFVRKPINISLLKKAVDHYIALKERLFNLEKLERTIDLVNNKKGKIFIQTTHEHLLVNLKDIIKIEAEGNYATFFLQNGTSHLASKTLKYYENLFSESTFFRASRFTLVNTDYIERVYKKNTIILNTGGHVHVSARNKSKLIDFIKHIS